MTPGPHPEDEAERLQVLRALHLHSGLPDLSALVRLACQHAACPIGAVGIVESERLWFAASQGLGVVEVPRNLAFCGRTILADGGLVVTDARLDPHFAGSPLLASEPPVAFYAGMPISVGGRRIGSVCVMDHQPRSLSADQLAALADLATLCGALLEGRVRDVPLGGPATTGRPERPQSRLTAVLQAIPDLWFVIDEAGRYLECSDEEHPFLVGPYAELHGRAFDDGVPTSLGGRGRAAMRAALASGQVQRFEYELDCRDGTRRHFEARVSPMGQGQTLYVTRDLTEIRQRELDLLIMQRALEAETAVPICVADARLPELPLIYVNPAFERLTGWRRDEVLGRNCRLLQGGRRDQPGLATLREALAAGRPCTVTLHNERRDGSAFINELHVAPVRDASGVLTHFIGVQSDVTQRSRAAEQLALSEDLYRSVAAAINDGLQVVDAEGNIVTTNPAGCEIFGVEAHQVIGTCLGSLGFQLLFEDGSAVPDNEHPVRRVRLGEPSLSDQVHFLCRPDGSRRLIRMSVRPLRDEAEGRARACLVTFSDITSQRAAEQALRDKQAAELANRAKSEFLSRVSHEMRTPLNAVIGFTQLLRLAPEGSGPAQVAQYTDHVLRASEHLLALINDLLDLQRVDEGRLALQMKPLALKPLVDATIGLLQPLALQHGVALQSQVDGRAWVIADAQRLRQVLLNIVSNAIKYNRSGGWVCVNLGPEDDRHWALTVEDTGSGLTQQQLALLFQPFERLGHESSGIEGSGLGLLIARRLVEEMGGQLTLSSVPAAGTLVRIALQAAAVEPSATAAAAPASGAADADADLATDDASALPLRMLYVEDNRINVILFEEAVRMRGGIELQIAEDGAEALALVQHWHPEVLVLDANLPDMSGYDVLARLRELPALAGAPAFMCSADAMEEDVQRATAAGFRGYWTKPIDIARVMDDLDRLVLRPSPV